MVGTNPSVVVSVRVRSSSLGRMVKSSSLHLLTIPPPPEKRLVNRSGLGSERHHEPEGNKVWRSIEVPLLVSPEGSSST